MKNPWMSLWLSAANRTAATARGLWLAEARKNQQALAREMAKPLTAGLPGARPPARRKRK
ncbi:hypothetical protein [Amaricoccus sp.]|uniref:hypothetical protein n=1 Tax=Amaricoccus sp. TaxID=1872485 RepID=UPI001B6548FB|nr:hypothetical protein [Amaricoccus sp.]MBP7242515.1 hypothetical protein [Amaricoccus sp.]